MPRKEQGWITFQTSEEERRLLEEICQQSQRTKTEILRELVRSLAQQEETSHPTVAPSVPSTVASDVVLEVAPAVEGDRSKRPLKVSSRNILKGVIKRVVPGSVNSEITLEIVHRVQLTSIITRTSAEELELAEGKEAYAVIKSSDIVIAME